MTVYYVYSENCDGVVRIIRCADKVSALEIGHVVKYEPPGSQRARLPAEHVHDTLIVTARQTVIKAALYRPFIDAQDHDTFQIVKTNFLEWLKGDAVAPPSRRAIELVNNKQDHSKWWFGFEDTESTIMYHNGI